MTEAAQAIEQVKPPETFMKTMEVDVTAEEQNQRKDRLVAVDREIIDVEAEKANKSSEYANQIKTLKKERVALLSAIGTGRERRDVACYLERDDRLGVMRTKRVDNNAVIDERALTLEERQTELFDEEDQAQNDTERPPADEGDGEDSYETNGDPTAAETSGDEPVADQSTVPPVGKVIHIKASDARKKSAGRKRKAAEAAEAAESEGAE